MARFVVLSFDDNAEAEAFVNAFKNAVPADPESRAGTTVEVSQLFFGVPAQNTAGFKFQGFSGKGELVGLFMRPTQFCDCAAQGKMQQKDGWSQGQKYGLWVHKCGKPNKISWEDIQSKFTPLGFNLLLPKDQQRSAYGTGVRKYYAAGGRHT